MPAIMRRTPTTEEASSYGYIDFLKDIVQKTIADTTAGFKRPTDFSDEEIMEMAFAGVGGGTKISKGLDPIKGILKRYKSQGLTYDAFVNQIPDKPKFAYHQWTFRGEGPLARATVTTKGTSLDEFEEMVADRLRKFAKPMVTSEETLARTTKKFPLSKVHFDKKGNIVILPESSGVPKVGQDFIDELDPYKLYEKDFFALAEKRAKSKFEITEINVAKQLRRKGIGSELYRKLAEAVGRRGGKLFLEESSEGQTKMGSRLIESLYKKGTINKLTGRIK